MRLSFGIVMGGCNMAGILVTTLAESAGDLVVYENSNITNTWTKIDLGTASAAVELSLVDLGSSTAKIIDFVFNSVNDAAADAALATPGSRVPVPVGKTYRHLVPDGRTKISRIDFKARNAETGQNIIITMVKV